MLVYVRRAKLVLQIVGVSAAAIGSMALPLPRTSPKGLTQSFFERVAPSGAFTRQGLVLMLLGLGCLALAALLPSSRE